MELRPRAAERKELSGFVRSALKPGLVIESDNQGKQIKEGNPFLFQGFLLIKKPKINIYFKLVRMFLKCQIHFC